VAQQHYTIGPGSNLSEEKPPSRSACAPVKVMLTLDSHSHFDTIIATGIQSL
jgi:hypothetical protein